MTAIEVLIKQPRTGIHDFYYEDENILEAMQEFAKMKCKELLEIVAEKASKMSATVYYQATMPTYARLNKDSILNCVDLETFCK